MFVYIVVAIFVNMLLLLLLFLVFARAEWPPETCDSGVSSVKSSIEMTHFSQKRHESSCVCGKPWDMFDMPLYIHVERKSRTQNFSNKSFMGFKFMDSTGVRFHIFVHDRRMKLQFGSILDCPDMFVNKSVWIRIRMDYLANWNQTSVSVSYASGERFLSCGRFELGGEVSLMKTEIHAATDTGMAQTLHVMQHEAPRLEKPTHIELADRPVIQRLESLERLLMSVKQRTSVMEQQISGLADLVNDLDDMKYLEQRFNASMSETGWRMSIGFCVLFVVILLAVACLVRRMHLRERIHIL